MSSRAVKRILRTLLALVALALLLRVFGAHVREAGGGVAQPGHLGHTIRTAVMPLA